MSAPASSALGYYLSVLGACWRFCHGRKPLMVLIYILFLGANIAYMTQPYFIGRLINSLQSGEGDILRQAAYWLSLYVGSMMVFWIFHGPSRVIERELAFDIRRNFILFYYDVVCRMPFRWHQDHHTGNTINRIQKASGALFQFAGEQFFYFETFLRASFVFIAVAFVDWRVSLALFLLTILIFSVLRRFDDVIMRKIHVINEGEHNFSSSKFDYISNIWNVITFNLFANTAERLSGIFRSFHPSYAQEIRLNELKWFIMMTLIIAAHFGVLMFYIWYHIQPGQVLLIGTLVTIFQYMQRLDTVFHRFAELYLNIVRYATDLSAVAPLDRDFAAEGVRDDSLPDLRVSQGDIRFRDLTFAYNDRSTVFRNLDLHIPAGQKIGLIGPSGAGKTSLINTLLRYNTAQRLDIEIDGQNIHDVNAASLRAAFAIIPQDTSLFQATLRENIMFGRLDATEAEMIEAARQAHADDFIRALPDGYDSLVGERGVKLSGGQRQRVAIARAILRNAPILILDEATSALDSESEKLIQESLQTLMQGKTVIAIAHRLSTIAHLDRLIVLENGQIVEDGTHTELLSRDGLYARLWAMQSGGFLQEEA